MLAIIAPAHNEEDHVGVTLDAAFRATADSDLRGEAVRIVIVADSCNDRSVAIAARFPVTVLRVDFRNVGAARAAGAAHALEAGARWLAFTNANSTVTSNWLSRQLAFQTDAVCGIVNVADWSTDDRGVSWYFRETYRFVDGHRHVHGANLGVSSTAYQEVGGFRPLTSDEDVDLVARLEDARASICWTAKTKVITSSRRSYRAPLGFGATLERIRRTDDIALGGHTGVGATTCRVINRTCPPEFH